MVTQGSSSNLIRSAIVTSRCLYVVRFNIHIFTVDSVALAIRLPSSSIGLRLSYGWFSECHQTTIARLTSYPGVPFV